MLLTPLLYMLFPIGALAATPAQWRDRIIYQVVVDRFARSDGSTTASCVPANNVYCGGSWQGLINQLDYIKNMGFTAVWISPVTAPVSGNGAWHGYAQQDIYSVNSHFGTAATLKSLSDALHSRGMYLMVDIVVNHYGSTQSMTGQWSSYRPFNSQSYFHTYCTITQAQYDAHNQTAIEGCWIVNSMPDVNTTQSYVKTTFQAWVKQLVSNYTIDGFRVDTAKHVQKDFWRPFNDAGGVYMVGEVLDGDVGYTCDYTNYMDGVLNYPLFFALTNAFKSTSGSISSLASTINNVKSSCKDVTFTAPFLENHDQPRFPYWTSDQSLIKNAMLTTLMSDGPPIIYQGQEWALSSASDPYNREAIWLQSGAFSGTSILHGFIAAVNQIRNWLTYVSAGEWGLYKNWVIWSDSHSMALRKGFDGAQSVTVVTNQGSNGASYTVSLASSLTGWSAGTTVVELVACTSGTVDSNGNLNVPIASAPQIWVATSVVDGVGLCDL